MRSGFFHLHWEHAAEQLFRSVFCGLVSLSFPQNITILLQRTPDEFRLLPQVGRQETVRVADSNKCGF